MRANLRPWPQPEHHHDSTRVETIDQLDWLRAEGCNEVQGFLFSAVKSAAEVEQLLFRFGAREPKAA